jgi:hypothetical protein
MQEFLRPNSRFIFRKVDDLECGIIGFNEQLTDVSIQMNTHLFAHEYNILINEPESLIMGRDLIGPSVNTFGLPDGFLCKDYKAYQCHKLEVDYDIIHLPLDKIKDIAKNMQCAGQQKTNFWEFWWSPLDEKIPFFLF